jgi:hypothetical protein
MSKVTFAEYIIISKAISDAQLEEGAIWDAIKSKLGKPGDTEDDLKKLKDKETSVSKSINRVQKTKQQQEFELRKAEREKRDLEKNKALTARDARLKSMKPGQKPEGEPSSLRGSQLRSNERKFAMGESTISESKDFVVTFQVRGTDEQKIWKVKGRDVPDVKHKFGTTHYGAKIITIAPAKIKKPILPKDNKPEWAEEE